MHKLTSNKEIKAWRGRSLVDLVATERDLPTLARQSVARRDNSPPPIARRSKSPPTLMGRCDVSLLRHFQWRHEAPVSTVMFARSSKRLLSRLSRFLWVEVIVGFSRENLYEIYSLITSDPQWNNWLDSLHRQALWCLLVVASARPVVWVDFSE